MTAFLSLVIISKIFRIFIDTAIDNKFDVFDNKGKYIKVYKCPKTKFYRLNVTPTLTEGIVLFAVIFEGQETEFSILGCTRDKALHNLKHILMCPGDAYLYNIIENNLIGNNPYWQRVIINAKNIFGLSVLGLKEKTMIRKSKLPREDKPVEIPPYIAKHYKYITLSIDVIYVNKILFIVSKSYHIGYYQCIHIRHSRKQKFIDAISEIFNKYKQQQIFKVTHIEGENIFKCIRYELQVKPYHIWFTTCDADKHVHKIEGW